MDPQQTLSELLEALKTKRWTDAKELAESLHQWLINRGFPPITIGDATLGKKWHRAVAAFVCMAAISKANDVESRRTRRRKQT